MEKLQVKAYFFNAKTDYLPYYKEFLIKIDEEKTFKELLEEIKKRNANFSFPDEKLLAKIESITIPETTTIKELIHNFSNEFTITPVSLYRSINGLVIDDSNFQNSYKLLEKFCDNEDFEFYQSLYDVHFASSSFDYNKEYLGDAILILAQHLIEKYPEKKDEILEIITHNENALLSCEYENLLLDGKDYSEEITKLQANLEPAKETILDKIQFIGVKEKEFTLDEIENKTVAVYFGKRDLKAIKEAKELINTTNNKFIPFKSATRLAGQKLQVINPSFALKKASKMLLDAYDSGAEVLLFANKEDRDFFRKMLPKAERVSNRAINLELFSLEEFKEKALNLANS